MLPTKTARQLERAAVRRHLDGLKLRRSVAYPCLAWVTSNGLSRVGTAGGWRCWARRRCRSPDALHASSLCLCAHPRTPGEGQPHDRRRAHASQLGAASPLASGRDGAPAAGASSSPVAAIASGSRQNSRLTTVSTHDFRRDARWPARADASIDCPLFAGSLRGEGVHIGRERERARAAQQESDTSDEPNTASRQQRRPERARWRSPRQGKDKQHSDGA